MAVKCTWWLLLIFCWALQPAFTECKPVEIDGVPWGAKRNELSSTLKKLGLQEDKGGLYEGHEIWQDQSKKRTVVFSPRQKAVVNIFGLTLTRSGKRIAQVGIKPRDMVKLSQFFEKSALLKDGRWCGLTGYDAKKYLILAVPDRNTGRVSTFIARDLPKKSEKGTLVDFVYGPKRID
jgi:hypothetical protein